MLPAVPLEVYLFTILLADSTFPVTHREPLRKNGAQISQRYPKVKYNEGFCAMVHELEMTSWIDLKYHELSKFITIYEQEVTSSGSWIFMNHLWSVFVNVVYEQFMNSSWTFQWTCGS